MAMADSEHSLVMTNLSPCTEAVKPGEWKSRKEKVSVADPQRPRSKVTLRALLLAAINLTP